MRDPLNVIERYAFESLAAGGTAGEFPDAAMVPEGGISGSSTYYVQRIQLPECDAWRVIQPVIKLTDAAASGELFICCVPRGTTDDSLARTVLGDVSLPGSDVSCSARVSLRAQVTPSEASVVESWGLLVPDGTRGMAWDLALVWTHDTLVPTGVYVAVNLVRGGAL